MNKIHFKLLLFLYILFTFSLLLYSFTQIDLNLTLSRVSIWQVWQKKFMYIGYFQRPLSTTIYSAILFGFFTLYSFTLYLSMRAKLTLKQLWIITGIVSAVLFLSYPAFSHDIFNYMFDARTVVKYGEIPYYVKPLDFSTDPWLNFMHWTHRPGIYPPLWIIITLPLYILGFNTLIPIILNFKAIVFIHYLGSTYVIGKIMEKINIKHKIPSMVFFALNPLIIIESLISAHNDIIMMFWALLAFYILQKGKRIFGLFLLAISVALKWVTIFLLPLLLIGPRRFFALLFMLLGLVIVIMQTEILPWYFLWVLPFLALNVERKWIVILSIGFSLGLLLRYTPFLYLGHWNPPVPMIKFWVTIIPTLISSIIGLVIIYVKKNH